MMMFCWPAVETKNCTPRVPLPTVAAWYPDVFQPVLSVKAGSVEPGVIMVPPLAKVAVVPTSEAVPAPVDGKIEPVEVSASAGTLLKFHCVKMTACEEATTDMAARIVNVFFISLFLFERTRHCVRHRKVFNKRVIPSLTEPGN